ncbi:hypothetical protein D7D52_26885 [Nocardia yunnanensis]|uniref:Uncharacterized protein n=1 Tax=Nocardia yunnanensis TaxID=2382165 RepID=A0A386ZH37_9NOCA|nr:hypothetical protein [Nocardia yunnanensis]AYF76837.1 hypothetical protein D7D52_26885 [Nocardia yunnanensis]
MTDRDPQLDEIEAQRAALRAEFAPSDVTDDLTTHLDTLIAGLEAVGRELDEATAKLDRPE